MSKLQDSFNIFRDLPKTSVNGIAGEVSADVTIGKIVSLTEENSRYALAVCDATDIPVGVFKNATEDGDIGYAVTLTDGTICWVATTETGLASSDVGDLVSSNATGQAIPTTTETWAIGQYLGTIREVTIDETTYYFAKVMLGRVNLAT
jgi:hypothetical protein